MQVLTTHVNADFAALGAMLAAVKLYPQAALYFSGHVTSRVRQFYDLYQKPLPAKAPEMLNLDTVDELIIVNTQQAGRIGRFQPLLDQAEVKVVIYDNKLEPSCSHADATLHLAETGSLVSFLVCLVAQKELPISELEATVMALGIHADTGSLTKTTTSEQDLASLKYLIRAGADLKLVYRYMHSPLSNDQYSLLEELLINSELTSHQGINVLISICTGEYYVDGLAVLIERLATSKGAELVFALIEMEECIYLAAASRLNHLPASEILARYGGTGHALAATAVVRGRTALELKEQLVTYLENELRPPLTAVDIMSSPVHTASIDSTMAEVGQLMLRYGHSGLPVIDGEQLCGVISRRDVDKSINHGLEQAAIKGFLTSNVVTVTPTASLDEIQRLLIGEDIGRLPVIDASGVMIGIITRSDLLKALHSRSYPYWYHSGLHLAAEKHSLRLQKSSVADLMTQRLSQDMQGILWLIGQEAARQKVRAYLVGGAVRDLLLGVASTDIDIVVEPSAIEFAEKLAKTFGATVQTHPQFNTATVTRPDGIVIDLATARSEFYASPAALPAVETGQIKQDLYRRDFTINTMAIALDGTRYGQFLDFFSGQEDLAAGIVRVLYNLSFVDDPTRILRAIRFEQRYGFAIEEQTMRFLKNALEHDLLHKVSAARIKAEIVALLSEKNAPRAILRLHELGVWHAILPGLQFTDDLITCLRDAKQQIAWFENWQTDLVPNSWLVYLLLLTKAAPAQLLADWHDRLALTKHERTSLLTFVKLKDSLLAADGDQSMLDSVSGQPVEVQIALSVLYGSSMREQLTEFWLPGSKSQVEMDGHDLLAIGFKPGPKVGEVLSLLHTARLNGQVVNKAEELALARQLLVMPEEGR